MEPRTHSPVSEAYRILSKNILQTNGTLHSIIADNPMPYVQNKIDMTSEEYNENLIRSLEEIFQGGEND
jgi:hypothetical protein